MKFYLLFYHLLGLISDLFYYINYNALLSLILHIYILLLFITQKIYIIN